MNCARDARSAEHSIVWPSYSVLTSSRSTRSFKNRSRAVRIFMLAAAACAAKDGPFKDFDLSEEQWEALHIAGWLHDCGKVTTPEYVVDKATKLETIYDRIHEIRTRFEVLKRDAQIEYWKSISIGGDREALRDQLERQLAALDEEFAFVAGCNEGGEFLDPKKVERLRQIGARTWLRTLDDRLGVSRDERARRDSTSPSTLSVIERLLADKAEHIIRRTDADRMPADNTWGFQLDVPEHKHNRGELHNLAIARGTLNAEERYIINHHIDPEVFELFLTSGVYRRYAEQYLHPEQVDEVDIAQYLS
jgi:hypothetical protein